MPNPPRPTLATLFAGANTAVGAAELLFGEEYVCEFDETPRLVIVPGSGAYETGPEQRSAAQPTHAKAWAGFTAHLWATSLDDVRELERAFVAFVATRWPQAHRLLVSVYEPAAVGDDTRRVSIGFQVREPLMGAPATTVTVTAVAIKSSDAVPDDGVLQAGES